jgi:hypothetical protein
MTHDQIDRMVRKANPVRDPNTLGPVDVPVLTTPLERRTEMQIDDRPGTEVKPDRNRRLGPLIGVAAAAAVILLAGLVFVLTRDDTPVAEPAPNATQISTVDFDDTLLVPGAAYFVDTDGNEETATRGTFVIEGSGWTSVIAGARKKINDENYVGFLVVEVAELWSPVCEPTAPMAAGSTAVELANQFAANGLTVREALAPVNAFGYEGHHLVVEVPALCYGPEFMAWAGPAFDGRYYQWSAQILEFWFLDVEGTPVMVEAGWFPGSREEDLAELRAVLDTLVITP